jgi:hypothetical protein
MQLRHLINKFGEEFWSSLTLTKVSPHKGDDLVEFWKRAECFSNLFERNLLPRRPGPFDPIWMILASRPHETQIDLAKSSNLTFAGGLKTVKLKQLTGFQIRSINPDIFGKAVSSPSDLSSDDLISNMSWPQAASIPPPIFPSMSLFLFKSIIPRTFLSNTLLLTCNQIGNLTTDQVGWVKGSRYRDVFRTKENWCRKAVNDTILYDGDGGFRWSEEKKGFIYTNPCQFAVNEWSADAIAEIRLQEQIFDREYEETKRDNIKKVSGCRCGIKICYNSECYEEEESYCSAQKPGRPLPPSDETPPSGETPPSDETPSDESGGSGNSYSVGLGISLTTVFVGITVLGFIYRRTLISKTLQMRNRMRDRYSEDRAPLLS